MINPITNYILFTRDEKCNWCDQLKEFLKENGITFQELVVGKNISRDEFVALLPSNIRPTVPQLFVFPWGSFSSNNNFGVGNVDNFKRIGGYEDAIAYFST